MVDGDSAVTCDQSHGMLGPGSINGSGTGVCGVGMGSSTRALLKFCGMKGRVEPALGLAPRNLSSMSWKASCAITWLTLDFLALTLVTLDLPATACCFFSLLLSFKSLRVGVVGWSCAVPESGASWVACACWSWTGNWSTRISVVEYDCC
ncbi:hypothetical protein HDK64DRAFT_267841 [Phyllosticta capitalensis]